MTEAAHRASTLPGKRRCKSCKFWASVRQLKDEGVTFGPNDDELGECRRFPPACEMMEGGDGVKRPYAVWPITAGEHHWCAEWQPERPLYVDHGETPAFGPGG